MELYKMTDDVAAVKPLCACLDDDKELESVPFMLEHGRYIPSLDHGVSNEVSWDNYRYFYDRLRDLIWNYAPAHT